MTSKNANASGLDAVGAPAETNVMYIDHPSTFEPLRDNDGNAMWIEVYGQDSKHYRQVQNDQKNKVLAKAKRAGGMPETTAEQQEARALEVLSKCAKDWYIVIGGEMPACNEAKAREVFESYPWLREQVDDFIHDRSAFLKS